MKVFEILNEQMPSNQEIAQMKKDSADLQKMSASGNVDNAVAINTMQRMATTAAKADIGSQMLKFFQMFAAAIKEGIDSGAYGNRVGEMQAAYDQIMAEMPMLKQMAADSRKMAVQHGGAGRQDVGEDQTKRDFAPTKADAMSAQGTAAVLKSKRDAKPSVEMMKIMNQQMKNMIAQKIKFANNVSKSSGTDPKAVDKMLAKQPPLSADNAKFKDKFSKTNETTSGSIAVAVNPVGKMQSRTMYNADGTMKNALDSDKLMAGKKKPKKNKQA